MLRFRALYLRTIVSYEAYTMMEVRWRNMIKNLFIREKIFSGISETDTIALLDTNLPILQIFVQVWRPKSRIFRVLIPSDNSYQIKARHLMKIEK